MRHRLEEVSFSGHETFPFRWRWLKKGVDAAWENPNIFGNEDAIVRLGVGKNMVKSIRHWCIATGFVKAADRSDTSRRGGVVTTDLGARLLRDAGWDPYLDDVASLWLIHWLLTSSSAAATTWYIAFTVFNEPEFTRDRLTDAIATVAADSSARATRRSIARDVDCFLRTYMPSSKSSTVLLEDSLECPLVELGLIQSVGVGDTYRFSIGPKASLPLGVFGFAMSTYLAGQIGDSKATLSIEECLYGAGSPGQAFKLDENSLVQLVEDLGGLYSQHIGLSETAGVRRVYQRASIDPLVMLEAHYEGSAVSVAI